MIHHQFAKDPVETIAQRNGHHAVFLLGSFLLGLLLGRRLLVTALLNHVFDLQVDQLAQTQAVFEGLARLVGMHMHLDQAQIAHHQHAVANAVEAAAEGINILLQNIGIQILDQELRAIGKLDFADRVVVIFKGGVPVSGQLQLFGGYFLAPQAGGIAHVDEQKSAPAGIHHAGLGQCGQHLLRLLRMVSPVERMLANSAS